MIICLHLSTYQPIYILYHNSKLSVTVYRLLYVYIYLHYTCAALDKMISKLKQTLNEFYGRYLQASTLSIKYDSTKKI